MSKEKENKKKKAQDLKSKIKPDQLESLEKKSLELKERIAKEQLQEKIRSHTKSPVRLLTVSGIAIFLVLSSITFFKQKADNLSNGVNPTDVPRISAIGKPAEVLENKELPIELNAVVGSTYTNTPKSQYLKGASEAVTKQQEAVNKFNLPLEIENELGMSFRLIPPGEFLMGSPSNEERHDDVEFQHLNTIVTPLYVGKFEVTVKQWETVMGRLPRHSTTIEQNPVTGISLNDALTFVQMLNRKLSKDAGFRYYVISEKEWEYSCRAGTETAFSFGPKVVIDDYAVSRASTETHNVEAVGLHRPNAWGLHDMHGNAMEWTRTPFFIYACNPQQYAGINMADVESLKRMLNNLTFEQKFGSATKEASHGAYFKKNREMKSDEELQQMQSWDTPIYDGQFPENLISPLDTFDTPTRAIGSNLDICYYDINKNKKYDKHEPIWKDDLSKGTLKIFDPDVDLKILTYAKEIPAGTPGEKNGLFYYDKNNNFEWDINENFWARNDDARKNLTHYILRGGSYYFYGEQCRSAYRTRVQRQNEPSYAGLRVVIYLDRFNKSNKK
jgi:formylglycine-generating enzyme required for sulfatase activity